MSLLAGKVALITGGSRGIGESIVMRFAEEGANVAFTYVSSEQKAQEVVSAASKFGVEVVALKYDTTDYAQAESRLD